MSVIGSITTSGSAWPSRTTRDPEPDTAEPKQAETTPESDPSGTDETSGSEATESGGTGATGTPAEATPAQQTVGPTATVSTPPVASVQSVVMASLSAPAPDTVPEVRAEDELARARAAAAAYAESARIAEIGERLGDTGTNAALSVLRPAAPDAQGVTIATGTATTLTATPANDARVAPARAA